MLFARSRGNVVGGRSRFHPVYVRLKSPPGIGAVQTRSGQRTTIGEDRIVEMSAEDANCLIPDGWIKLAEWSAGEAP